MSNGTSEGSTNFSPTNLYQYEENKEESKGLQITDFANKNTFNSHNDEKIFTNQDIDENFDQSEINKMELEETLNSSLSIANVMNNFDQPHTINLESPSIIQNINIQNSIITQQASLISDELTSLAYQNSLTYISQNLSNLRDLITALASNTNLSQDISSSFQQLNTFNTTLEQAVNAIQTQIPQSQQHIHTQLNAIRGIIESNTVILQNAMISQIKSSSESKIKKFVYSIAKILERVFGSYLRNPDFHIILCFIVNLFFFKYLLGLIPDMNNKEDGYFLDWLSTSRQAHLLLGVNTMNFKY